MNEEEHQALFDETADEVVDLGNQRAAEQPDADPWVLADGLIAGAVHYWLYAHQPQDPPDEDDVLTARERVETLMQIVLQAAEDSEYLHSPQDTDVGRA